MIEEYSPVMEKLFKTYLPATSEQIAAAITKARSASGQWRAMGVTQRVEYTAQLCNALITQLDHATHVLTETTGKSEVEAIMGDILPILDIIRYYEKYASSFLHPQSRPSGFLFPRHTAYVDYTSYGVVLIISPWNYPLQLSMIPLVTALIAGNTCILKPSEVTPSAGVLIEQLCEDAQLPAGVVQVLQGDGEVGEKIIEHNPDMIFFTGSVKTGKRIMEMASRHLISLVLELGGKDAMIVFDDADFDRAVEAAVYGAFVNAGQVCVGIERIYVQDNVYERFALAVAERTKHIRVGTGTEVDIGAMTTPFQTQRVEDHVKDALEKGATALRAFRKEKQFVYPIVLRDVNHTMKIMKEETFGPVAALMPFYTEDEAIELANDSRYGLNASVWSRDIEKAKRVVSRLDVGNAYINDVVKNIGNPHLPFGGVKESGFGRYHGPEGLYTFSRQKSVMINRNTARKEMNWFPYTHELREALTMLMVTFYGKSSLFRKIITGMKLRKQFTRK